MLRSLAEIVVEAGVVDAERVAAAEKTARRTGEPLLVVLVEHEGASELAIHAALARALRVPVVELAHLTPDPEATRELPHDLARKRRVLALGLETPAEGQRVLRLAMADPTDLDAVAEVELATGAKVVPALAALGAVESALVAAYRGQVTAIIPRVGTDPPKKRVPFGGNLNVATPVAPPTPAAGPKTEPFHRLEDELPVELRLRALLEILEKKGVINLEEYAAAVRRLLEEQGAKR